VKEIKKKYNKEVIKHEKNCRDIMMSEAKGVGPFWV